MIKDIKEFEKFEESVRKEKVLVEKDKVGSNIDVCEGSDKIKEELLL